MASKIAGLFKKGDAGAGAAKGAELGKGAPEALAGKGAPKAPGTPEAPGAPSSAASAAPKGAIPFLYELMQKILGGLNRHLGKILAVFVFLIILVLIFSGAFKRSKKKRSKYKDRKSSKGWFQRMMDALGKVRSPLGGKAYGGLPRSTVDGRCNDNEWLTVKKGKVNMCINTKFKQPPPARVTINPTNLYDYDNLPYKVKTMIRQNSGQMSIKVPYKYNEVPSAYVLDFSKATFQDGKSAKALFNKTFNFDSWEFNTQTVPRYTERDRYIQYKKTTHKKKKHRYKYKVLDKFVPLPKRK